MRATLETAPSENHDSYMNRLDYLSPAEQQAEMMAEKERYFSLYSNEVEEEMYKGEIASSCRHDSFYLLFYISEEKLKRELANSNQVPFSYDDVNPKEIPTVPPEPDDNDSTPFTPSVKLDLPVDMEIPPTLKLNQIIEKTAKFIASQGPQMEILLKTKQASNPQFDFLNHNGQYNSYYKHILGMMKAATYPWKEVEVKSEENSQDAVDYRIKSSSPTPPLSAIVIPKMVFKPSADCTYTQLISKITKAPIAEIEKQKKQENETENATNGSAAVEVKKPLFGLVHYSSDSESEEEEEEKVKYTGVIPPSELQLVIDKTAIYVAKNGVDFEETLRKKSDVRFQFLDAGSEYHEYYIFKVNESRGPTALKLPPHEEPTKVSKAPPAPVCFSIKPKEEKSPLKPTVLQLQITSSDDENKEKSPIASEPPRITSVEEELELQVDAMNAEREEKAAKEKLTDKLMSAAREKLGMFPKEKMLQIERKKKAMMFINQMKESNGNSKNGSGKDDEIHSVGDSDDSVKSIPIASSSSAPSKSTRSRSRFVVCSLTHVIA